MIPLYTLVRGEKKEGMKIKIFIKKIMPEATRQINILPRRAKSGIRLSPPLGCGRPIDAV